MKTEKMNHKHNKKRNPGLVYEFFIRYMGNSLIDKNNKDIKKAIKIFNRFFKDGTELCKEFKLMNALVSSHIQNDSTATNALYETKTHLQYINQKNLEREKSLLIREINHNLNDENFFNRKVPEYRVYATIQNLFNEWKNPKVLNIKKVAEYEDFILKHLKNERQEFNPEHKEPDIDALTVKIMTEKLNKKYGDVLNVEQRNIIQNYVFSCESENKDKFKKFLETLKNNTLTSIKEYLNEEEVKKSKIMKDKLTEAIKQIEGEDLKEMNDELIQRFLEYSQLKQEIMTEDENS